MRRTASEVIRELEIRVARLERKANPSENTNAVLAIAGFLQKIGLENISFHGNYIDGKYNKIYINFVVKPVSNMKWSLTIVNMNNFYTSDQSVNTWKFFYDGERVVEMSTGLNTLANYLKRVRMM